MWVYIFFFYLSWKSHCFVCYVRYLKRLHAQETCHWWQEESLEKEAQVYPFSFILVYIFICIICMIVFIIKANDIFYGYPFGYLFGCWEIWENASQWKCGIITVENVLLVPIWVLVYGGLLGVKEIWDGILSIFGFLFCDNKSWTAPLSLNFGILDFWCRDGWYMLV